MTWQSKECTPSPHWDCKPIVYVPHKAVIYSSIGFSNELTKVQTKILTLSAHAQ